MLAPGETPQDYELDGVKLGPPFVKENIEKVIKLEFDSEDVLIVGYPKSGNTWLQDMVWLICNDADIKTATEVSVMMRAPLIDSHHGYRMGRPSPCDLIMAKPPPRIMDSHLPYKLIGKAVEKNKPKVIVVFRNPKDVIVSYFHFHRTKPGRGIQELDTFFEHFMKGDVLFGDWFQHTRDWWARKEDSHILALTYEGMKADHTGTIEKIANFLGKDLSKETVETIREFTSFDAMKKRPAVKGGVGPDGSSFYRKGAVGDWKNSLSEEQVRQVDERYLQILGDSGLQYATQTS